MERPALKTAPLWAISVTTTPAAEEPVAALMQRIFGRFPASYTDVETGRATVTVYCAARSEWTAARRASLLAGLEGLRARGGAVAPAKLGFRRLARRDWAESWKQHFRPLVIGGALLIQPSWCQRRQRPGQTLVVLDPGLSFGTGHHPTTAFCLEQLVARRQAGAPQPFLDVGTGSGILAIAAAKLGYAPVAAFDHDPVAVRVARANALQNGLEGQVRCWRADLTRVPLRSRQRYALVCANLLADLLVQERWRLIHRLAPGGRLVVAGILRKEFATVRLGFEEAGLRLVARRTQDEWCSGAFAF